MKTVFEECMQAFNASSEQYWKRRSRITGESADDIFVDIARAHIASGIIMLSKQADLGVDYASTLTQKVLGEINDAVKGKE